MLIILATLSGMFWGTLTTILVVQDIPDIGLILGFLIFALTAGAIPSLGIISQAYFGYVAGLLLPVSIAFISKGTELNIALGTMTIIYASFLILSVGKFRGMLNSWFQRSIKNDKFTNELINLKRRSDQSVLNLESAFKERRAKKTTIEHNRITLSNLRGQLPGMTYRAVNDGFWSLESVSEGCQELLGLTFAELKNQGKKSLSDILVRSDRPHSESMDFTLDDGESFQYEYTLLTPWKSVV